MNGKLVLTKEAFKQYLGERGILPLGDVNLCESITGVKPLNEALSVDASFCRFDGGQGLKYIEDTKAGLVFIPEALRAKTKAKNFLLLPCDIPRLEILRFISRFWCEKEYSYPINSSNCIHETSVIDSDVKIGPFTVIGPGVQIGAGSRIGPNCHIENAVIGEKAIIGSSVTIGGAGFGFEDDASSGETLHFPHIGSVRIGDDVFVGSSTCIDRGSIGDTVIGDKSKIDNLVHIAHNVRIGKRCKIIALAIIGGSVDIGDDSWISPAAAIRDWRSIGKGALVGLGAVVTKDVVQGDVVVGNPAKSLKRTAHRYK